LHIDVVPALAHMPWRWTAMLCHLSRCPTAPLQADGRALRVGSVVLDGLQTGSAGRQWWDTGISCSLLKGLWQGSRFIVCSFSGSAAVAFVIRTAYRLSLSRQMFWSRGFVQIDVLTVSDISVWKPVTGTFILLSTYFKCYTITQQVMHALITSNGTYFTSSEYINISLNCF
jgi:hypothetical protein